MSLFASFFRPAGGKQVTAWAVEVARRCHAAVSIRLGQQVYRMNLPEARGYIRARSAHVLDGELVLLRERTGCDAAVAQAVRERAFDEVIRLAIGDLLKATRTAAPLRKAA